MRKLMLVALALGASTLLLSAAGREKPAARGDHAPPGTRAVCVLHPTKGNDVHGKLVFTQKEDEIEITGEITGLSPGMHAFHVHEFGDCSSPDAMSAGAHFNPAKAPHGGPHSEHRHVGDLGNIKADEDGKVVLKMTDKVIQLNGPHSIVGRSIIVHAMADDEKSQPAGNAGARVACGVIGLSKPADTK
jgi:Cu-Zn family superoxide dismutase